MKHEHLKVVREHICESIKPVLEEIDGKKSWVIEGIGIQMNTKNANDRVYVPEPMLEQLEDYCKHYLAKNRAVGELNHPVKPEDQVKIDPERIAVKFTDIRVEGNNVMLKGKPAVGLPMGDIVNNLLNNEIQLGFSSRALAKLVEKKDHTETHCRKIITVSDIVWDPSVGEDALINGILEGKEWVYENGVIVEAKDFDKVIEEAQYDLNSMTSKTKDKIAKKVIMEYFDALFGIAKSK